MGHSFFCPSADPISQWCLEVHVATSHKNRPSSRGADASNKGTQLGSHENGLHPKPVWPRDTAVPASFYGFGQDAYISYTPHFDGYRLAEQAEPVPQVRKKPGKSAGQIMYGNSGLGNRSWNSCRALRTRPGPVSSLQYLRAQQPTSGLFTNCGLCKSELNVIWAPHRSCVQIWKNYFLFPTLHKPQVGSEEAEKNIFLWTCLTWMSGLWNESTTMWVVVNFSCTKMEQGLWRGLLMSLHYAPTKF